MVVILKGCSSGGNSVSTGYVANGGVNLRHGITDDMGLVKDDTPPFDNKQRKLATFWQIIW